jgi:hypothetical protein
MNFLKSIIIPLIAVMGFITLNSGETNAAPRVGIYAPHKSGPNYIWVGGHYKNNKFGKLVWIPGHWKKI